MSDHDPGHTVIDRRATSPRPDEYDPRARACSRCGLGAWHPSWSLQCGTGKGPVSCGIHGTDTSSGRCVDCDRETEGRML